MDLIIAWCPFFDIEPGEHVILEGRGRGMCLRGVLVLSQLTLTWPDTGVSRDRPPITEVSRRLPLLYHSKLVVRELAGVS